MEDKPPSQCTVEVAIPNVGTFVIESEEGGYDDEVAPCLCVIWLMDWRPGSAFDFYYYIIGWSIWAEHIILHARNGSAMV